MENGVAEHYRQWVPSAMGRRRLPFDRVLSRVKIGPVLPRADGSIIATQVVMRQELCRSLVMASTLAASLASAQTSEDKLPPGKLETEPSASLNRFGLNYRM